MKKKLSLIKKTISIIDPEKAQHIVGGNGPTNNTCTCPSMYNYCITLNC